MLKKLWQCLVDMQNRRAAYWMLQHMSDSQLKDIGVSRGEIQSRVYGPSV